MSSKSIFTELNWLVTELNSFRCSTTNVPSDIFRLNNCRIRCTLLEFEGFSYMFERASIRHFVVVSFKMLNATLRDSVNRITPNACLSRSIQSSAFVASSFVYERGWCNFIWYILCIFDLHLPECKVCAIELCDLDLSVFCHCTVFRSPTIHWSPIKALIPLVSVISAKNPK